MCNNYINQQFSKGWRFPFNPKIGNLRNGAKYSVEISPKSSLKIRKLLNFHLRILQPEIERRKSNGAKNSGKKFSKIRMPCEDALTVRKIPEKAVPFASKCPEYKPKVSVEYEYRRCLAME